MPANIKAIVFKTTRLKESRDFFENLLKLQIKESSARHFVIYSKSIRLVFVDAPVDFEVEIYIHDKSHHFTGEQRSEFAIPHFKSYKDPNGISVMINW